MIKNMKILGVFIVVFSSLHFFSSCESNFKNSPRKHFRNSSARAKPKIKDIIAKQVKGV